MIAANPKEKMPLVKLKTIEEGSAALVRNHLGEARLVSGKHDNIHHFFHMRLSGERPGKADALEEQG